MLFFLDFFCYHKIMTKIKARTIFKTIWIIVISLVVLSMVFFLVAPLF